MYMHPPSYVSIYYFHQKCSSFLKVIFMYCKVLRGVSNELQKLLVYCSCNNCNTEAAANNFEYYFNVKLKSINLWGTPGNLNKGTKCWTDVKRLFEPNITRIFLSCITSFLRLPNYSTRTNPVS